MSQREILERQAIEIANFRCPGQTPAFSAESINGINELGYWYMDNKGKNSSHLTLIKPRFLNRTIFPRETTVERIDSIRKKEAWMR
jgi:hypothetical protein